MALEITFGVRGKTTKQAFFIQESDWEASLSDVRKIIELQELHVPLEYKFLTLSGNAIAHPSEEDLLLKNITLNFNSKQEEETDDVPPDLELKSEKEESKEKLPTSPEIWVTPLKVTFSSPTSPSTGGESQEGGSERDPLLQGGETSSDGQQTSSSRDTPGQCKTCPFKAITDTIRGEATPKTLLKVLFALALVLFAGLASLTLTMHVLVKVFTDMSQDPTFNNLFSKLNGGSSETLTNMQVKFSKMEMSSKYEFDRLHTRIRELEDLYLNDLAVHKRELNILKQQVSQSLNEGEEEEDLWEAPPSSNGHLEKEYGKNSQGKENRNKG